MTHAFAPLIVLFLLAGIPAAPALPSVEPEWHYTPPADDFGGTGRPPNRTSGGARGDCTEQLIALSPGFGEVELEDCGTTAGASPAQLALTVAELPTLWFYVPESAPTVGELVLLDDQERPLAIAPVSLPGDAGVIGVRLPTPLALDRPYRWEFSLGLTPSPAQNPRVDGMIKRISLEPTVVAQLTAATPLQQAALYANQGIWQDALTILAHQRQLAADASLGAWTELLASVGLGAIAPTPMLNCCPSQPIANQHE